MEEDLKYNIFNKLVQVEEYINKLKKEYQEQLDENLKMSEWLVEKQHRIEELQKENEELNENYKVLENAYITDSIPKSVIQDNIYELGNMKLITVRQREEVSYAMGVLQELLNKGE